MDYCALNHITIKDSFVITTIDELFDELMVLPIFPILIYVLIFIKFIHGRNLFNPTFQTLHLSS